MHQESRSRVRWVVLLFQLAYSSLQAQDSSGVVKIGSIYNFPDFALGIAVSGNTAYLADGTAGLKIFDVSDPGHPNELGCFDSRYANDAEVIGNLVYLADNDGGFKIIDITDPSQPELVGENRAQGIAYRLAIRDSLALVTCLEDGVRIFDISNPANPRQIGLYNSPGMASDVYIVDTLAYIADGDAGLCILNISNPARPRRVSSLPLPDISVGIDVDSTIIYVAANNAGLITVDVQDPLHPVIIDRDMSGGQYWGVTILGNFAYIANVGGLMTYDISRPNALQFLDSWSAGPRYYAAYATVVADDIAYIAYGDADLQMIDVSNPNSLQVAGSFDPPGTVNDVMVVGSYAYVADDKDGLRIVDISQPSRTMEVGSIDTPGEALGVFVLENYAYVADSYTGGLRIIDISDPTNPQERGWLDTPDWAHAVVVVDSLAYVADGQTGLLIVDVSDVSNPVVVSESFASGIDIAVSGQYAFVSGWGGFWIFDISNPNDPQEVSQTQMFEQAPGIAVSGNYVYVTNDYVGLVIYDISDLAHPNEIGSEIVESESPTGGISIVENHVFWTGWYYGLRITEISNPETPQSVGYYQTTGRGLNTAISPDGMVLVADATNLGIYDCSGALNINNSNHASQPLMFSLDQNYPNPFNASTLVAYSLPNTSKVTLKLFDEGGREVQTLVNDYQKAGLYRITLDASDLTTGLYFYRLQAGETISTRRMLLQK